MTEGCNNYKQEMNEGVEICSLCNKPVTKIESNVNPKFYKRAMILAFVGLGITTGGGWILGAIMGGDIGMYIMDILGLAALVGAVFFGIKSKSKLAIILPIIFAVIGIISTLFMYGIIEF